MGENPQSLLANDEGNFVLKKDGTPKKKPGRPQEQPNFLIKLLVLQVVKSVISKKSETQKANKVLQKKKETIQKLDKTVEGPVTKDELDNLPKYKRFR